MLRTQLIRAFVLVALLAGIATGGALAAADNSVSIGQSAVPVSPNGYRFAINVACGPSATATPCNGQLSMRTLAIKPYRSLPKRWWPVGLRPFSIPAGKTAPVRHRLLAGALVQLKLTGRVKVLVTIYRDGSVVGTKLLTLRLKR